MTFVMKSVKEFVVPRLTRLAHCSLTQTFGYGLNLTAASYRRRILDDCVGFENAFRVSE